MNIIRRGSTDTYHLGILVTQLKLSGFEIQSDNQLFNLELEAAVRCFQEHHQLEKDGIVGPATWDKLMRNDPLEPYPIAPLKWVAQTQYFPQRDNDYNPSGTCNVTCLAMVLSYHGVSSNSDRQLEDELYLRLQKPDAQAEFARSYPSLAAKGYKPRHVHGMLRWLAQDYGFYARFDDNVLREEMTEWGTTYGPMILSGKFTGSGHIVTMIGQTAKNDFIVHDPYGDWNTAYKKHNGAYRIYNREDMEVVLSGRDKHSKRCHRIRKK